MAVTYDEIKQFLDKAKLNYFFNNDPESIILSYSTENYIDAKGEKSLRLVIGLRENGEYFNIFAPSAYKINNTKHKLYALQAFMMTQWKTKLIQFEYDDSDGEIRPIIEFPLEDAKLGEKQFHRLLQGIVGIIDNYDPVIRKAMETGKIEFPASKSKSGLDEIIGLLASASQEELKMVIEAIKSIKAKSSKEDTSGVQVPDSL